jgi:hypothetical protein
MQPRNLLVRLVLQSGFWQVVMGAMLFLGAGTMDWPQGWAFLVIFALLSAAFGVVGIRHYPDLLEARLGGLNQPGQPLWDKFFTAFFLLVWLGWLALMGADAVRWRLSQMPEVLNMVGATLPCWAF